MIPPRLLLAAYRVGAFPMALGREGPIAWFTADPRAILPIEGFHVPRRLARFLRRAPFSYTVDRRFAAVIEACADREETWISNEMIASYAELHRLGYAHSVEVWQKGVLVGGLYGVQLGAAFFAESMFHRVSNASKAALVHLVERLRARQFLLLDIQEVTRATESFRPLLIPHAEYLARLEEALRCERRFD